METTRLSSKGQVILPKSIRAAHQWEVGVEFLVEDTADGVFLRATKPYQTTRLEEVIACTGYTGPAKTVEDMDAAIAAGIAAQAAFATFDTRLKKRAGNAVKVKLL